jgi:hypothetical protein
MEAAILLEAARKYAPAIAPHAVMAEVERSVVIAAQQKAKRTDNAGLLLPRHASNFGQP